MSSSQPGIPHPVSPSGVEGFLFLSKFAPAHKGPDSARPERSRVAFTQDAAARERAFHSQLLELFQGSRS